MMAWMDEYHTTFLPDLSLPAIYLELPRLLIIQGDKVSIDSFNHLVQGSSWSPRRSNIDIYILRLSSSISMHVCPVSPHTTSTHKSTIRIIHDFHHHHYCYHHHHHHHHSFIHTEYKYPRILLRLTGWLTGWLTDWVHTTYILHMGT